MLKIRKSVFETNSSSMHTLVMSKDETWVSKEDIKKFLNSKKSVEKDYLVWNDDHTGYYLTIENDSFGREYRMLNIWHAKLQYVAAALGIRGVDAIIIALQEYLGPEFLGLIVDDFNDGDSRGWHEENLPPYVDYSYLAESFGDIDHQSNGMIEGAMSLIDSNLVEAVKNIIFNNKYVIIVDGDETMAFDELLSSGFMEDCPFTYIFHESYEHDENGKTLWDKPVYSFMPVSKYLNRYEDEE